MTKRNEKHTVVTDALKTLGTIHKRTEYRDAIHLAVEPVEAGEDLDPGEHIMVVNRIAWGRDTAAPVGIVDPFLVKTVKKGEKFWCILYPRTIKSLRHVWTHPAFPDELVIYELGESKQQESEKWLRDWVSKNDAPDYEALIRKAVRNSDSEYLHFDTDAHGEIPDEVWDHIETVTGKDDLVRAKYFTCAC